MAKEPPKQSFHPFPRLPTELRLQIWACAMPSSFIHRDIGHTISASITQDKYPVDFSRKPDAGDGVTPTHLDRSHHLPTIFSVNRESRSEAAFIDGGAWFPLNFLKLQPGNQAVFVYLNLQKERLVWFYDCYRSDEDDFVIWGKHVVRFWRERNRKRIHVCNLEN
jgi:hypothetical protein